MKKMRRLSIEYRHREVTITVEGSTLHVQDGNSDAARGASVCPACGGSWITMTAPPEGDLAAGVDHVLHMLQQSGLHVQASPAGELLICQSSFDKFKETL
jgi:hypothetical protein